MAQLTSKVFQVLDDRHTRNGADVFVAAGQTTIEPGMLVTYSSGSTVSLATAGTVHGAAFGTRAFTYAPTTQVFAAGEPLVVIEGEGEALISSDFFVGATLPTAGSLVYAGASGLWTATAGTVIIGRCLEQQTVRQPVATGTSITVARVLFNFTNNL
jgi:hypothetical protein